MVSIGKGVLNKTIDVKVQALLCLNFDVNRFVKYSFSYRTSHIDILFWNTVWSLKRKFNKTYWINRSNHYKNSVSKNHLSYVKDMWRSIGKGLLFKTFDVKFYSSVHFVWTLTSIVLKTLLLFLMERHKYEQCKVIRLWSLEMFIRRV